MVKRVLLASPRGYCAGVDRAVETLRGLLELRGPPVFVRKEIVHNAHTVREFEALGAVFVDSEDEVPEGAAVVFSAHGVSPAVRARAAARGLDVVDATCPLVTKVHLEARAFAARGYRIVLIGHAGHEEVEGTMGQAPDAIVLVQSVEEAEHVDLDGAERLAYLTQTTLSIDETAAIVGVLERRYPQIVGPRKSDICYATTNRQEAVKALLPEVDLVLVVGSANSSNSNRLVETARAGGVAAHLIEDEAGIDEAWLADIEVVGLTAGASVPERLVHRVCDWFGARGVTEIRGHSGAAVETVAFGLPVELRALGARPA